jgi:hypothetical protein
MHISCPRCGVSFGGGNPWPRRSGAGWRRYFSSVRVCPSCGGYSRARLRRGAHLSMAAGISLLYLLLVVDYLSGHAFTGALRAAWPISGTLEVRTAIGCIFGLLLACTVCPIIGLMLRRWGLTYEPANEP